MSNEPVRTPTEVAERQAALQKKLDRDPQFFYTTVSRSKDAPLTPPANETAFSVVLDIGGQEVRYDLAERYPGAAEDLGEPMLVFADDEHGELARRTLEAARDASGPLEISSGLGLRWPRIPVGLRGLVPEESASGSVSITPVDDGASEPADVSSFAAVAAAGDIRLGVVFVQLDAPVTGWEATMVATAGGLELLYSVRFDEGVMHHRVDWRHTLGQGPALDQLLTTRLLASVLDGAELTLSLSEQPEAKMTGAADTEYESSDVEQLRAHEAYLELVCEVQRWIGVPIEPPARPTQADVDELRRAVSVIRQPQRGGTWREVDVAISAEERAPEGFEAVVLEAVYSELFGERHYLGIDLIALGPCQLNADGDKLLPASGGGDVLITLQHPDKAAAEAAAPREGKGTGRLIIRSLAGEEES